VWADSSEAAVRAQRAEQIWFIRFNQIHETHQTNKINQPDLCSLEQSHGRLIVVVPGGRPMNDHAIDGIRSSRKTTRLWPQLLIGAIGIGMVLAGLPAHASDSQTPWECSSYTGDAHTRCLEAFAESQRDQIATLQGKLQAQQDTINHLTTQLNRQASTGADLQRQLARPPAVVQTVPPLYSYPPMGFSLYMGSPWTYGAPYYYPLFYYGLGYYGPHRRGHRL
jgi:hypothetical protein